MPKSLFAAILALATTMSASAHIWNGVATHQDAGQRAWRTSPCPPSYDFQKGFCLRVSRVMLEKVAADDPASADPSATTRRSKETWVKQTIEKILGAPDSKADNANNDLPASDPTH